MFHSPLSLKTMPDGMPSSSREKLTLGSGDDNGVLPGGGFAHDFQIGFGGEQRSQAKAEDGVVVGDEDADHIKRIGLSSARASANPAKVQALNPAIPASANSPQGSAFIFCAYHSART